MLLGFLIGGAVAVVGVIAGGGMVMLTHHMDERARIDPKSLSGRLSKSLEEKDRVKREESGHEDAYPTSGSLLRR